MLRNTLKPTLVAATLSIGLLTTVGLYAQEAAPGGAPGGAAATQVAKDGGTMPMMEMMGEMKKMMEGCDRMMQASSKLPAEAAPQPRG